jgi:hypothetical protein
MHTMLIIQLRAEGGPGRLDIRGRSGLRPLKFQNFQLADAAAGVVSSALGP